MAEDEDHLVSQDFVGWLMVLPVLPGLNQVAEFS